MMVKVADSAVNYLQRARVGVLEPENACFRMKLGAKGPHLLLDETRPDDIVVEHDGSPLLAVDAATAEVAAGRTLIFDEERLRLALTA